jgi:type I restriction enzyme S subunit
LREAQELVINRVNYTRTGLGNKVSVSSLINSHQSRFEAEYFISEGMEIKQYIETLNHKLLRDVSKPIFRPGIFKRHYVETGIDFLGGSDIVRAIPRSDKKLSIAKTKHLDDLKIEEDWILVTCGGTIGFSVLVDEFMSGKTASQHILRVIADEIPTGYLFAFMSSKLGLRAIQSFTYGSVIPQIEPHHLELLPIPILEKEVMNQVHELIMKYKRNISTAINNELKAIDLVEKEIESWQK